MVDEVTGEAAGVERTCSRAERGIVGSQLGFTEQCLAISLLHLLSPFVHKVWRVIEGNRGLLQKKKESKIKGKVHKKSKEKVTVPDVFSLVGECLW